MTVQGRGSDGVVGKKQDELTKRYAEELGGDDVGHLVSAGILPLFSEKDLDWLLSQSREVVGELLPKMVHLGRVGKRDDAMKLMRSYQESPPHSKE